ncbi:MAG: DUF4115 domain-containing protein [Candidatus Kaelpia aquatica]|nr:DUF4115 domain-containing protein [Candidatus Kaelpia aquatica]
MANIGIKLRKARQKLGYDYDFITQKARIHPKVLQALEDEDFGYFKSALYLRSFLGKYVRFLGLDEDQILSELDMLPAELKSGEQGYVKSGSMPNKLVLIFKTTILSLFIVSSIYFVFLGIKKTLAVFINHDGPDLKMEDVMNVEIINDGIVKVEDAAVKKSSEEYLAVQLTIKASEDCWIQLRADSEKIFDSILKANQSETWNANEEFELWVGEASRLSFILNGRNIGPIGRGIIKGIKITSAGIDLP